MKHRMWAPLVVAMLVIGGFAQAQASTIVYDNGAPNQVNGNEMTAWIQAEDFTLAQTTLITDVHFWSLELTGAFTGSIYYAIYADVGGQPNLGAPAIEGFLSGDNLTRVATGNSNGSYDEYFYSFDIDPFNALGGVTYWLGLHNGPLTETARLEFYWGTTGLNGTFLGHEDFLPGIGDGWASNGQEHAFQLTGTAVPEPATFGLLGLGLLAVAAAARRRR